MHLLRNKLFALLNTLAKGSKDTCNSNRHSQWTQAILSKYVQRMWQINTEAEPSITTKVAKKNKEQEQLFKNSEIILKKIWKKESNTIRQNDIESFKTLLSLLGKKTQNKYIKATTTTNNKMGKPHMHAFCLYESTTRQIDCSANASFQLL